jgi:hypothetical protein
MENSLVQIQGKITHSDADNKNSVYHTPNGEEKQKMENKKMTIGKTIKPTKKGKIRAVYVRAGRTYEIKQNLNSVLSLFYNGHYVGTTFVSDVVKNYANKKLFEEAQN